MSSIKVIIGILFFTLTFESLYAQYEYKEFPTDSVKWLSRLSHIISPGLLRETTDFEHILTGKDTVINNQTYKQIYYHYRNERVRDNGFPPLSNLISDFDPVYWGAIREENKQIFIYRYEMERLIYDFNLNIGDEVPINFIYLGGQVIDIDTINLNGLLRKRFLIQDEFMEYFIYEGMGSNLGLWPSAPGYPHMDLICMSNSYTEDLIYLNPLFDECYRMDTIRTYVPEFPVSEDVSLYPNPATEYVNLNFDCDEELTSIRIIDIKGSIVSDESMKINDSILKINTLHDGIYFIEVVCDNRSYSIRFFKK